MNLIIPSLKNAVIVLTGLLFGSSCVEVLAKELQVCQVLGGPGVYFSLEAAIRDSDPGDVIRVCEGIHTEPGVFVSEKNDLTIMGQGVGTIVQGADTIDGADNRVFTIVNSSVTISALTIRHGGRGTEPHFRGPGGAIYIENSSVWLENATISENRIKDKGAGVFLRSGSLNVSDSIFENNRASGGGHRRGEGGAIAAESRIPGSESSIKIHRSVLRSNRASYRGGAISVDGSTDVSLLENTRLEENFAPQGGGLKFGETIPQGPNFPQGKLEIKDATFHKNRGYHGGAVYFVSRGQFPNEPATIDKSIFSENHTRFPGFNGGAIRIARYNWIEIRSSEFLGNEAYFEGGAIAIDRAKVLIQDSTIHGNTSTDREGGGISTRNVSGNSDFRLTVNRSTISANTSPKSSGAGIHVVGGLDISNSTVSHNIAAQGGGGLHKSATGSEFETIQMTNVTVAHNQPVGVLSERWIRVKNSIISNNGLDCEGPIDDAGLPSLDSDGSCNVSLSNANANLGPLANNRNAATKTHALLPGSDAIDAGDDATCDVPPVAMEDQTRTARPEGLHCDLGAYETFRIENISVDLLIRGSSFGQVSWDLGICAWLAITQSQSGECTGEFNPPTAVSAVLEPAAGGALGDVNVIGAPHTLLDNQDGTYTITITVNEDTENPVITEVEFVLLSPEDIPKVVATSDQGEWASFEFPGFKNPRFNGEELNFIAQGFDVESNVIQWSVHHELTHGNTSIVRETGDMGLLGPINFFVNNDIFRAGELISLQNETQPDASPAQALVLRILADDVWHEIPITWTDHECCSTVESIQKAAASDPHFVVQIQFVDEGAGLVSANLDTDPVPLEVLFHAGEPVGDGFAFESFHAGAVPGIALNPLGDGAVVADIVDTTSGAVVDGLLTFRADTPGANLLLRQGQESEFPGVFISRLVNVSMDGDGVIAVQGRVSGSGISSVNDEAVWVCIAALCSIAVQEGMERHAFGCAFPARRWCVTASC